MPQVMESGLGALTAANRTLSQFQAEVRVRARSYYPCGFWAISSLTTSGTST